MTDFCDTALFQQYSVGLARPMEARGWVDCAAATVTMTYGLQPLTIGPIAAPPTQPIDHVIGRLREFKFLGTNWNGYGGAAPTSRAVENCVAFLQKLAQPLRVLPDPMVSGTGEVGLFWEVNGYQLEVGFTGNNKYGYVVLDSTGGADEDENVDIDSFPEALGQGLEKTAYAPVEANE